MLFKRSLVALNADREALYFLMHCFTWKCRREGKKSELCVNHDRARNEMYEPWLLPAAADLGHCVWSESQERTS